jgi:hypothetical protein
MSTISEVNLIDVKKEIPVGGSAWEREVVEKLSIAIAAKVNPLKTNIRVIQPNLLPIVVGLSGGKLLPKKFGGNGELENLSVTYLGDSAKIREEKEKNPKFLVIEANLIEIGHCVFLAKDFSRVFIADSVEAILKEVK